MTKFLKKLGALTAALLIVCVALNPATARVTGASATDADVFCSGNGANEVCIDKDGNLVPTTASGGDLGTSALPFGTVYTGALSATGTLTLASGAIDTAKIGFQAVDTRKMLIRGNIDTVKILCVDSHANSIGFYSIVTGACSATAVP